MKETNIILEAVGWCNNYGNYGVLMKLSGTGPKGKLKGTVIYLPHRKDVSLKGIKQGIHRLGWDGDLREKIETAAESIGETWAKDHITDLQTFREKEADSKVAVHEQSFLAADRLLREAQAKLANVRTERDKVYAERAELIAEVK